MRQLIGRTSVSACSIFADLVQDTAGRWWVVWQPQNTEEGVEGWAKVAFDSHKHPLPKTLNKNQHLKATFCKRESSFKVT